MRFPLLSRIVLSFGAILLLIGFFVRMIFSSWDVSSLFYVSTGIVCVAASAILDLQGFYRLFQPRTVRRGLRAFGLFIGVVCAVIALNYFLAGYQAKLDFSPGKKQTLSEFSKKVVKGFSDTVEVVYLQIPGPDSKYTDDAAMAAIKKFQDENPKIRFTKYNILEHPELVEKYKLADKEQALIVTYKDHFERFYKMDEESVTKAFLRLQKGRKTIYFSVGHGESKTDDKKQRGLSGLRDEIERLFYDVVEINLEDEMIPEDAAGLAIVGPDKNLSERAQNKVLDYLQHRGRVYLAFDPVQNPDQGGFLKKFGLQIPADQIVHQEDGQLAGVASFVISGSFPNPKAHPILENMESQSPVMFYVSSPILTTGAASDFTVTEIVKSPPTSTLRAGYTKQDKLVGKGSYTLFAVAKNSQGGEIFVSGDTDIFANQFLYQGGNGLFMFNLFSYLSTDDDMIKVPPSIPTTTSKDFYVSDTIFKIYIGFFILGLPALFLSCGGLIWARRRWM